MGSEIFPAFDATILFIIFMQLPLSMLRNVEISSRGSCCHAKEKSVTFVVQLPRIRKSQSTRRIRKHSLAEKGCILPLDESLCRSLATGLPRVCRYMQKLRYPECRRWLLQAASMESRRLWVYLRSSIHIAYTSCAYIYIHRRLERYRQTFSCICMRIYTCAYSCI